MSSRRWTVRMTVAALGWCGWLAAGGHAQVADSTALAGLALAETYLGRLADARDHADEALRVIESFHANVANPELRELDLSRNQAAYALYIGIEMLLEIRQPGQGHRFAALMASARARARELSDLLYKARPKITAGVDAQLLSREQQLTADAEHADERSRFPCATDLAVTRWAA